MNWYLSSDFVVYFIDKNMFEHFINIRIDLQSSRCKYVLCGDVIFTMMD